MWITAKDREPLSVEQRLYENPLPNTRCSESLLLRGFQGREPRVQDVHETCCRASVRKRTIST